jgi:hypothetical protein
MRTTLMLEDDLLFEAREIASYQDVSLGEVISQLARRGLESNPPIHRKDGIPVFERKRGAKIAMDKVIEADAEE